MTAPRRTREGAYIVAVDELRVGDREPQSAVRAAEAHAIAAVEEKPKTRVLTIAVGRFSPPLERRMRRTTMVARAPRKEEAHG